MTHDEIQDLLEGYVDETLDRPTRKVVDDHLRSCQECRAILDDVAPVDLTSITGGSVDERRLRRSVRKAMRRTVFDAALTLFAGWLALWFITAVLLQPLLVNRGGRAAMAARATIDTAVMFNPGVVVSRVETASSWLHRTVSVSVVMPVGTRSEQSSTIESSIGVFDAGGTSGGLLFPFIQNESSSTVDAGALQLLGPSTVATISLVFPSTVTLDQAQSLADATDHDVRVIWAGFPISDAPLGDSPFNPGAIVGYDTCGSTEFDMRALGATMSSSSSGGVYEPASIERALDEVRRALDNLANSPLAGSIIDPSSSSPDRIRSASAYLEQEDPGVAMIVATGPSVELAGFLEEAGVHDAGLLGVDFYNWTNPVCGR